MVGWRRQEFAAFAASLPRQPSRPRTANKQIYIISSLAGGRYRHAVYGFISAIRESRVYDVALDR